MSVENVGSTDQDNFNPTNWYLPDTIIRISPIVFDSQTITLEMMFLNAEVTDEGIMLHPAPGYRTFWAYWNGRWYDEHTYLRTPGIGCRAILRYFDDGDHNAAWLENINLPDWRFERLQDLLNTDSLLVTVDEYKSRSGAQTEWFDFENMVPTSYDFHSPDANGEFPVGHRVNLPFVLERARWAILESRKTTKK